jgi:hypothetical protein
VQATPQAPQLDSSVVRLRHSPLQQAYPAAQVIPQPPQLPGSSAKLVCGVQAPLQQAYPEAHS